YWDHPQAKPYLQLIALWGGDKETLKKMIAPVDPITYADNLKKRDLLMLAASRDDVVPPAAAKALWEATGKQKIVWFNATHVGAVIVSHAHIDHCGNLPSLIRQGFDGPIYCTAATRDLLAVMLVDSAKIQEEDAAHMNIARNYAEPFVEPLYTRPDVDRVLAQ